MMGKKRGNWVSVALVVGEGLGEVSERSGVLIFTGRHCLKFDNGDTGGNVRTVIVCYVDSLARARSC